MANIIVNKSTNKVNYAFNDNDVVVFNEIGLSIGNPIHTVDPTSTTETCDYYLNITLPNDFQPNLYKYINNEFVYREGFLDYLEEKSNEGIENASSD